jgi:hypothetical protein
MNHEEAHFFGEISGDERRASGPYEGKDSVGKRLTL